jgi:hypothetical protein
VIVRPFWLSVVEAVVRVRFMFSPMLLWVRLVLYLFDISLFDQMGAFFEHERLS